MTKAQQIVACVTLGNIIGHYIYAAYSRQLDFLKATVAMFQSLLMGGFILAVMWWSGV